MSSTTAWDASTRWHGLSPVIAPYTARVLIVDPSIDSAGTLVRELLEMGVAATVCAEPLRALVRAAEHKPHAVVIGPEIAEPILSLMIAALRSEVGVPVLLGLRAGDVDRLGPAIVAGGQPVVELPYRPERLAPTVLALASVHLLHDPVRLGPLELDGAAYDARLRGHGMDLSALEFGILYELALNHDRVVPRGRLTERYWPGSSAPDGMLAAVVARLRRKMEARGAADLIHTVRGVGFRLDSAPLIAAQ